jgi:hypothetical protein
MIIEVANQACRYKGGMRQMMGSLGKYNLQYSHHERRRAAAARVAQSSLHMVVDVVANCRLLEPERNEANDAPHLCAGEGDDEGNGCDEHIAPGLVGCEG